MLKYAHLMAPVPDCDLDSVSDQLDLLSSFSDKHVRRIVKNLQFTADCTKRYAEFHAIDEDFIHQQEEVQEQANATWDRVTQNAATLPSEYDDLLMRYSDQNYLYCIALWNCAYQILCNEKDVYNETFGQFILSFEELMAENVTFGDERTEPLFKLISQIGDFRVDYVIKPKNK